MFLQKEESIEEVQAVYEPFATEVDQAEEDARDRELQDAWDEVAPNTEHLDAQDAEMEDLQQQGDQDPEQYDIDQVMGATGQASISISLVQKNHEMTDDEYQKKMRILNLKQFLFLYNILYHAKTSNESRCWFLFGGAGVGKTHTSTLLYQFLLKFLNKTPGTNPDNPLLAPTGKAAFLINGNTVHSQLKIPINQKLEYKKLRQ